MRLLIHDNLKVADIQERFQKAFPNLRLEFYSKAHGFKKGSLPEDMVGKKKRIGDIRTSLEEGDMEIFSTETVKDLEQRFRQQFGLHVQVFRKEACCLVQTTTTDRFTLEEQNEMAAGGAKTPFPTYKEQLDEYDAL